MNRYSSSKLKTFESCSLKYKNQYIDKISIEQPITPDTQFGLLVHKAAEIYNGKNKKEIVKLVRKYALNEEYKNVLKHTLQNIKLFYEKYNKIEAKVEQEIFYKNDIWLYGLVDRLMFDPLISVDYKTSKSNNRDNHIFQMRLYTLILSKQFNEEPKNIKCIIYYPRIGEEDKIMFSNQEIDIFEKDIYSLINKIENNDRWTANKGYHCKWCGYYNTKYCPSTME